MKMDGLKRQMIADAVRKSVENGRAGEFFGNWPDAFIHRIAREMEDGGTDLARTFLHLLERDRRARGQSFDAYVAYMRGEEARAS